MAKAVYPLHPQVEIPTPLTRFVTDEQWYAAQRRPRVLNYVDTENWLLGGKCNCPSGCGQKLVFYLKYERIILHCLQAHGRKPRPYISNVVMEELAVECVRNLCDGVKYGTEFGEHLRSELTAAHSELEKNVARLKNEHRLAKGRLDEAIDRDLSSYDPALREAVHERLLRIQDAANNAKSAHCEAAKELDLLSVEIERLDARVHRVSDYLDTAQIEFPWRPKISDSDGMAIFKEVAEMIRTVEVSVFNHSGIAEFELVLFSGPSVGVISQKVQVEHPGILARNEERVTEWQAARDEFDQSKSKLTDSEFETLPPMPRRFGHGEMLRFLIDVIIVSEGTESEPSDLLWKLGEQDMADRLRHLRAYGGLRQLVAHLRLTRGETFDLTPADARGTDNEKLRLIEASDPIVVLRICDPESGQFELSDAQWMAIADVFYTARFFQKTKAQSREILDAYFAVIREDLPVAMADQVGIDAGSVTHLLRKGRHVLIEVTRRLLALEGYRLPDGYARGRRRKGSPKMTADAAGAVDAIKKSLPRAESSEAAAHELLRWHGVTCNLTTGEVWTDGQCKGSFTPNDRQLLRCLLSAKGKVVPHSVLQAALVVKVVGRQPFLRQAICQLRKRLNGITPELGYRIRTSKDQGYCVAGDWS